MWVSSLRTAHYPVGPYRQREDLRKFVKAIFDPLATVLKRLPRVAILATQERTAHASRYAVVDTGCSEWNK